MWPFLRKGVFAVPKYDKLEVDSFAMNIYSLRRVQMVTRMVNIFASENPIISNSSCSGIHPRKSSSTSSLKLNYLLFHFLKVAHLPFSTSTYCRMISPRKIMFASGIHVRSCSLKSTLIHIRDSGSLQFSVSRCCCTRATVNKRCARLLRRLGPGILTRT